VIGDNLWLWRADHHVAGLVMDSMNPCDHGLVVDGDHVTMYGLAVEHTLKDLTQWSGDHGRTYFYQSELPYDVGQDFGDAGYVGYRVNDTVSAHSAYGVGVYHFFRDFEVTVPRGIACPDWLENSFENPLSVSLSGKGTLTHVINDKGEPTHGDASTSWYCEKGPEIAPRPVATTTPEPLAKQAQKKGKDAQAPRTTEARPIASENSAAPRDSQRDEEGGASDDPATELSEVAASLVASGLLVVPPTPTGLRGGGPARPARSATTPKRPRAGGGHARKSDGSAPADERPHAGGARADRPWKSPWSTQTFKDGLLIERLDEVQATPIAPAPAAPAQRWIQSLVALQVCASAFLAVLCFLRRRQRHGHARLSISTSGVDADATAAVARQAGEPLQPRSPALRGILSPGTASPLSSTSDAAA